MQNKQSFYVEKLKLSLQGISDATLSPCAAGGRWNKTNQVLFLIANMFRNNRGLSVLQGIFLLAAHFEKEGKLLKGRKDQQKKQNN